MRHAGDTADTDKNHLDLLCTVTGYRAIVIA